MEATGLQREAFTPLRQQRRIGGRSLDMRADTMRVRQGRRGNAFIRSTAETNGAANFGTGARIDSRRVSVRIRLFESEDGNAISAQQSREKQ